MNIFNCTIDSPLTVFSFFASLVADPPEVPTLLGVKNGLATVHAGDIFKCKCVSYSGNPRASLVWLNHQNREVRLGLGRSEWPLLLALSGPTSNGRWACFVGPVLGYKFCRFARLLLGAQFNNLYLSLATMPRFILFFLLLFFVLPDFRSDNDDGLGN